MDGHETCEAKFHAGSRPVSGGKVLCHVFAGDDRPQRSCSLGMWADFLVLLQLYTAAVSAAVYCTVSYLCAPKIALVK